VHAYRQAGGDERGDGVCDRGCMHADRQGVTDGVSGYVTEGARRERRSDGVCDRGCLEEVME